MSNALDILVARARQAATARMKRPTPRQLEVHAFMLRYQAEWGSWPTVREIGVAFGIASTNGVSDHLRALERKGLARRRKNCARGWIALQQQEGTASQ